MTCIFCEIVAKRAPAAIVCEDANNLAFRIIEQESYGHTLVTPKRHYESMTSMEGDALSDLMVFVNKLTDIYSKIINTSHFSPMAVDGLFAQQSVAHFHFHYFPRLQDHGLDTWPELPPFDAKQRSTFMELILAIK